MIEHSLNIKCLTKNTEHDGSVYGKFVLEPMQGGYGTTIGNALRRVLLSSIQGSAITSARFEGVSHEFTNIDGVVEDVLDILLNFKGVVLKSETGEPAVLRLDVKRVGEVTAKDLELPAGIEVLNPDWHIATLSKDGHLAVELTVESGVGYVPADKTQSSANASHDALPLDAAFMPIRRVAYNVEALRVGTRTDYDSLELELWSDGSVDVTSALSQAANILIENLVPIASLMGVPTVVTQPIVEKEEVMEDNAPSITIEDLELSVRAFNCLKRANIHSIQELMLKSEHDLLNIKNFGKKSADEVIERLKAFGIDLKPSPEDALLPVD
ncbi:MAG: DNA-directed RNA polymerase subunit alpha [Vampirovibrionales bacterium]